MVKLLLHMKPQGEVINAVIARSVATKQSQRLLSAFLVFTFTATSIPSFGDSPLRGQSLLAPQSRFQSQQVSPSDPTKRLPPPNSDEPLGVSKLETRLDINPKGLPSDVRGAQPVGIRLNSKFGRYQILDEIGRGGMGRVYRGWDENLKRSVAIKVISEGAVDNPELVARFKREAEAQGRLTHPNIIRIYEIGEVDGINFISMQYVEGRPLKERIKDISLNEALTMIVEIARALDYAHSQGIIHRDIKPANILVDKDNKIYIADFGIAKDIAGGEELTQTGQAVGTPAYMSPEQARGETGMIGRWSDVYSLGVLLYEMLTEKVPFNTTAQIIDEMQEPPSPRKLNPKIPKDVNTIILKAMAKNPDDRYDTANLFANDIGRVLNHEPILAKPVGPVGKLLKWSRRNRKPILAGAGVLAAILTVAAPLVYSAIKDREAQAIVAQQKAEEETAKRIAAEEAKAEQEQLVAEQAKLEADKKAHRDNAMTPFNNAKALTSELTTNDLQKYREVLGAAIDHYTIAIAIDETFEDAFYERGRLKHRLNDYQGALTDYADARRLNDKLAAAYYFAAKIYLFQNGFTNIEEGRQLVEAMLRMNPEDDFAILGSAWILYIDAIENPNRQFSDAEKLAALKEVLKLCDRVKQKGTHVKELYDLLGHACWRLGSLDDVRWRQKRLEAARQAFEKLIALDPWAPTQYRRLAEVLEILGILPEAEENFNKYITLGGDPLGAAEFHARGFANENLPEAERQRHFQKTIEYFEKAVRYHPNSVVVFRERARFFIEAKQYDNAVADIESAISADPQDRQLYEILMLAHFKKWLVSEGLSEKQLITDLLLGRRNVEQFPKGLWNACKRYLLITPIGDLRYFGEIIGGRRALTQDDIRRYGNWLVIGKVIIPPMLPRISEEVYQEAQQLISAGETTKAEDYILHGLVIAPEREQQEKFLEALAQLLNSPVVSDVREGSLAERSGLIKGDCVLEVNGRRVANKKEFSEAMKEALKTGAPIRLRIRRDGSEREIQITPASPDEKLGIKIAAVIPSRELPPVAPAGIGAGSREALACAL